MDRFHLLFPSGVCPAIRVPGPSDVLTSDFTRRIVPRGCDTRRRGGAQAKRDSQPLAEPGVGSP
jgi:hypothetical protein